MSDLFRQHQVGVNTCIKKLVLSNSYSTVVGIYGNKPTEPESTARGQGRFTVAINS